MNIFVRRKAFLPPIIPTLEKSNISPIALYWWSFTLHNGTTKKSKRKLRMAEADALGRKLNAQNWNTIVE